MSFYVCVAPYSSTLHAAPLNLDPSRPQSKNFPAVYANHRGTQHLTHYAVRFTTTSAHTTSGSPHSARALSLHSLASTPLSPHTMSTTNPNIDPTIFTTLQTKIDEESAIRDSLRSLIDDLSRQSRLITSHLSRIHNTPTSHLPTQVLDPCTPLIHQQASTIQQLATTASQYPFHKYNSLWSRDLQTILTSLQLHEWLTSGQLLTLEQTGAFLGVPVNIKPPEKDTFHITIEDYLLALTGTVEELARLAPNSVTMGDLGRPLQISRFVKEVHAGFQLLNLKNDTLRRRSDGVKYAVKKVEDVVYDLSLRGLVPKDGGEGDGVEGKMEAVL